MGGGKGNISNAKYNALLRKWMNQRKKLKLAMLEMTDRTNFYRRQIAEFKKKQKKWLRGQKNLMKGKKDAVKFVFIDDVVAVKFHSKHKDRIKIVNRKGKEILVEKIKVIHQKGKKKKGKKKGVKDNNFVDDDPSWMETNEIRQELFDEIEKDAEWESGFFSTEREQQNDADSDDEDYDDL